MTALPSLDTLGTRRGARRSARALEVAALVLVLAGCSDGDRPSAEPRLWSQPVTSPEAALLSVHGTTSDDVWMVGADDGQGPVVLHWDGRTWERAPTGVRGDLWWVHATPDGSVYATGEDAMIVRWRAGQVERQRTPGLGKHTVYGLWSAADDDVYAVGSAAGRNGFVWHFDGETWSELPLPAELPLDEYRDTPGLFKVWGRSPDDVWVVGGRGLVLRGNAREGFRRVESGTDALLFTVHATSDRLIIVGGDDGGVVLELDGDALVQRTPDAAPLLQGGAVNDRGAAWAAGLGGSVYRRSGDQFTPVDTGIDVPATHSLHATWVDPDGGVWAVGGNVLSPELDAGVALRWGTLAESFEVVPPAAPEVTCPADAVAPAPDGSIARRWNEQMLNAIRRDTPRPTVHARNLYHVSLAMWDAWAAFDPNAEGLLVQEDASASELPAARDEAISYAAYRVLTHRYAPAVGGAVTTACLDAFMKHLGYDPADRSTSGGAPRALGNRIGAAVIEHFASDGSREAENYAAAEPFTPANPNLVVDVPGVRVTDPTAWQQLVLAEAVTQNGIPEAAGAQGYIGAHWGAVTPFALVRTEPGTAYVDPGDAPTQLDDALLGAVVDVIRKSAELDAADETLLDISPGAYGNNSLGADDGRGHAQNPITGRPYAPHRVKRGDFARVLAEFWADGPASETPPGHWNTLANTVADHAEFVPRLFGEGEPVDRLSWDVHLYLAMNGALHDAAIAAWELKRRYTTARPITLVRHLGGLGQRSDPSGPAYHPDGLPLVEGLIEVITEASSRLGERHAQLARYVGEIAIMSWRGEPGDRERDAGGCGWVRAAEWMPYQRRTFVTPAFPGYVSGHSTFSRAAAVVLSGMTGSEYFPGGLGTHRFDPGYLFFESGPSAPVELQWATYFDAADQAGQSRIWGGIHVRLDDYAGRRVGAQVGAAALERAAEIFQQEP